MIILASENILNAVSFMVYFLLYDYHKPSIRLLIHLGQACSLAANFFLLARIYFKERKKNDLPIKQENIKLKMSQKV